MTTVPANMNSTHKSGATPTVAPSTAPKDTSNSQANSDTPSTGDSTYPEQKHAGIVGYGPNYHSGPTLEDKIKGLKEEIKGKVTHKPDLVQHGRELLSGQERRKQLLGEDEPNPFQKADEDKQEKDSSKIGQPATSTDSTQVQKEKDTSRMGQPATSTDSTQVLTGHESIKSPSSQHHSQSGGPQALNQTYQDQPRVQATPPSYTQSPTNQDQTPDTHPRHQSQPRQPANIDSAQPTSTTDSVKRAANVALPPSSYNVNNNNEFHTTDIHRPSPKQPHGQTDKYPSSTTGENHSESGHQNDLRTQGQGNTPSAAQLFDTDSDIDRSSDQAPVHIEGGFKTQGGQPKANPFGMAVNQGHGLGAKEQAATVAPEGTKDVQKQRQGNYTNFVADAPGPVTRQ